MRLLVETLGFETCYLTPSNTAQAVDAALEYAADMHFEDVEGQWSVVIKLVDAPQIRELHEVYFDDPTPTDVITFPSGELAQGRLNGHLGDIAVCAGVAAKQAEEAKHSVTREIAFLSLHGLLHLLGHDDRTASDRERMLSLQERLLRAYEQQYGAL